MLNVCIGSEGFPALPLLPLHPKAYGREDRVHRFRLRLILALIASVTVVSIATTYFDVLAHRHVLRQELDRQTRWMALSILPQVQATFIGSSPPDTSALNNVVQSVRNGTGALGVAVYDMHGNILASAGPGEVIHSLGRYSARRALEKNMEVSDFNRAGRWEWNEVALPLHNGNNPAGTMAVLADAANIRAEANSVWKRSFWLIAISVILIAAITAGMVSWFLTRPMSRFAERLRHLRTGHGKAVEPVAGDMAFFTPIAREVQNMAESLKAAQAAATTEATLREAGEHWWTAERLAIHMRNSAGNGRIFVVSNREPYMHIRDGDEIQCVVPPSGLVTALEPVLRACNGVWVAFGSGDADTVSVDEFDHIRVPPDNPKYTLRRVWLSEEEETQYYDGFSNEGLWPLCHIAHQRPIFRQGDWECYQRINERFTNALLAEMKDVPDPIVFVQDYHFALLPRMLKRARPDARVAIFWHIPWPNPEAFGICPWQAELLDGLLGADLIGFHIPLHCHNFLSTVDRVLEARTDHQHLTTRRQGHLTTVHAYPISVACEDAVRAQAEPQDPVVREAEQADERERLLVPFGIQAEYIAIGVDRLDYTKGIVERLMALEQLLNDRTWYRERLTMVQIAAPSRTRIPAYSGLRQQVEEAVERINERFQTAGWKPVLLIERQCSHDEVRRWYTASDLCLVTSLHDGMNLVAKEFIAARNDEDGVLVLSRFTGAATELQDALIVNPYDIGGVAEAIHHGLQMSRGERHDRMVRMRRQVMEHNIYLWAASVLGDLRELRLDYDEPASLVGSGVGQVPVSVSDDRRRKTA
jgi:alpha,alpha-trehalose-phosphate synthase [UDP-forming]